MINVTQVGNIKKKMSFKFNFVTVQQKLRVPQMHWECIPGSADEAQLNQCEPIVFVFVQDSDCSSVTDDLR